MRKLDVRGSKTLKPHNLNFQIGVENYLTEICSGSEAGSYLRLMGFVYHSALGVRVIKKERSLALSYGGRPSLPVAYLQKCAVVPRRARM